METGSTSGCDGNPDCSASVLFSLASVENKFFTSVPYFLSGNDRMCMSPTCAQLGCLQPLSGCNFTAGPGCPACVCACDSWALFVFLSSQGRHSKHLLAVKPPWLLTKETQSFDLKAEGAVQSPTVTSDSIRRGEGEERAVSETWGILLQDINQA